METVSLPDLPDKLFSIVYCDHYPLGISGCLTHLKGDWVLINPFTQAEKKELEAALAPQLNGGTFEQLGGQYSLMFPTYIRKKDINKITCLL